MTSHMKKSVVIMFLGMSGAAIMTEGGIIVMTRPGQKGSISIVNTTGIGDITRTVTRLIVRDRSG